MTTWIGNELNGIEFDKASNQSHASHGKSIKLASKTETIVQK